MNRFYTPDLNLNSKEIVLTESESKHAIQVLRYVIGSELELINGKGLSAIGKIIDNHSKRTKIEIKSVINHPVESPIHIAIAPTKNMDRMEWFVEKATEIGVTKISFINCQNSERKEIKIERLEKVILSAVKQSGRYHLPMIHPMIKWKNFLEKHPKGLIAHCRKGEKTRISSFPNPEIILIGPEGDFTQTEVDQALESGYKPISLGENRLRTETAALVACIEARK
jgi:16S rRNA (uracil1498-N3)-methyltransferase